MGGVEWINASFRVMDLNGRDLPVSVGDEDAVTIGRLFVKTVTPHSSTIYP